MAADEAFAIGGLYVAVGLDADRALVDADRFYSAMVGYQNKLNTLDLTGGLEQRTRAQMQAAQKAVESASVAQQRAVESSAVAATATVEQQYGQRSRITRDNLTLQQAMEAKGVQQWGAMQQRATREMQAEFKRRDAMQQRATREMQAEFKRREQLARQSATRMSRVLGSGMQDLFVGLGAARSGNWWYGLAAAFRYAKNVRAELDKADESADGLAAGAGGAALGLRAAAGAAGGMSAAAMVSVGALVAVAAAGAAAAAGIAYVGKQTVWAGMKGAASMELLRIQLDGMLGSAARGKSEFAWLMELGKTSIVPTGALIAADQQLAAFGVTNDMVRRGLVEFASDFGTATGKTEQQIYYLNLALGQVAALGKANTVDMRQLANVGVSTAAIYDLIGGRIGKSSKDVAAGLSKGLVTSDLLFAALMEYGSQFDDTASTARQTTLGLLANMQDIVNINLSTAFDGANREAADFLSVVQEIVEAIDFREVAAATTAAIQMITNELGGADEHAASTINNILGWAGEFVHLVAANIASFIRLTRSGVEVINIIGQNVYAFIVTMRLMMNDLADGATNVLDWLGVISDEEAQNRRDAAAENRRQITAELKAMEIENQITRKNLENLWENPINVPIVVQLTMTEQGIASGQVPKQALDAQPDWYKDMAKRIRIEQMWDDALNNRPPLKSDDKGAKKAAQEKAAQEYVNAVKSAVEAANESIVALGRETTTAFADAILAGNPGAQIKTALEEAFSSGDIDTIVGKYESIRKSLSTVMQPFVDPALNKDAKTRKAARAWLREQRNTLAAETAGLVQLAAQRQALAKQLEDAEQSHNDAMKRISDQRDALAKQVAAQKRAITRRYDDYYLADSATSGRLVKGALSLAQATLAAATEAYDAAKARLDELVAARDDFLNSLRDSIRGFINAYSDISREVETYTRLDHLGSFSLAKREEADLAAFRQGLADRLAALRQWRVDVQALMAGGLDTNLLQDLVAAGPEQSGEIVRLLAGASASEIADINAVQADMAAEIAAMQQTASAAWFDAGINAQAAFLAPIEAAYLSAQAQVAALEEQRALALGVLEAWQAEQSEMLDAQAEAEQARWADQEQALKASLDANQKAAKDAADAINDRLSKLPPKATLVGVNTMQGLLEGMQSGEGAVLGYANRLANEIAATMRRALDVRSPSRVTEQIGLYAGQGLAVGMEKASPLVKSQAIDLSRAVVPRIGTDGAAMRPMQPQIDVHVEISKREIEGIVDVRVEHRDAEVAEYADAGAWR